MTPEGTTGPATESTLRITNGHHTLEVGVGRPALTVNLAREYFTRLTS